MNRVFDNIMRHPYWTAIGVILTILIFIFGFLHDRTKIEISHLDERLDNSAIYENSFSAEELRSEDYLHALPSRNSSRIPVVQGDAKKEVTTQGQTMRASGLGLPPPDGFNLQQQRRNARLAAITDAKRNLAEQIRGAIIESKLTMENNIITEDIVIVKVNTILKSFRIVSEKENNNGSFEVIIEALLEQ